MKKIRIASAFLFLCLGSVVPSLAETINHQSVMDRVTPLNKITDTIATIGKSGNEKKKALRQRKLARRKDRMQKANRGRMANQRRAARRK